MDSNCKPWQQAKLKRTKELIRQVLDKKIPKWEIPPTSTEFFDYVASHVHISRSALMRSGSHYRKMILSKYHDIKHANGLLEDEKLEIAKLTQAIDIKELELSNSKAKVDKLTKILSKMGEVQPANASGSTTPSKSYLKEYEEVCRAIHALLTGLISTLMNPRKNGTAWPPSTRQCSTPSRRKQRPGGLSVTRTTSSSSSFRRRL
ncbi:hypothetical protein [Pseudomonas avellanae]|uniref:hypothetical protein n=1 Tax=Pseudomonas avellanae TaxID=46257 RepID=UPI001FCA008C|nr:hypothetical protein [Pseudomonas avellanae]